MSVTATSRAVWIVPAAFLVVALADWPYGYYQLMRFVVCGACAYLAYVEYQTHQAVSAWAVALAAIAAVFNPIVPIHLTKEIWRWLDGISAVVIILHMILARERKQVIDRSQ